MRPRGRGTSQLSGVKARAAFQSLLLNCKPERFVVLLTDPEEWASVVRSYNVKPDDAQAMLDTARRARKAA